MVRPGDPVPTLAETARTATAAARTASVWPATSDTARQSVVIVRAETDGYGRPVMLFNPGSPVLASVAHAMAVTVSVAAPAPFRSVELTGRPERYEAADQRRYVAYRLEPAAVRVNGAHPRDLPMHEYWAALPDPLVREAARMVEHLAAQHGADLTACMRAHGLPGTQWAVPRRLDRYGLEIAVLTASGVSTARLPFPHAPVSSLREVAHYLRIALTCPCQSETAGQLTEED
jgi:Protein of unknown function (DUF2470)